MISVLTSKIYSMCVNMIALFGLTNSTVNSLVSHPEAYFMFLTNDILSFKAYLFLYASAISKQTHFSGLLRSSVVTGLLFIEEISALVRTEPSRFLITTERYASCNSPPSKSFSRDSRINRTLDSLKSSQRSVLNVRPIINISRENFMQFHSRNSQRTDIPHLVATFSELGSSKK